MSMPQSMMLPDERLAVARIVPVRFHVKYKEIPGGQLKAEEWVDWEKVGVNRPTGVPMRVDRIIAAAKKAKDTGDNESEMLAIWTALEPYYKNWKEKGEGEIISGTPLSIWTGITHDVVDALKHFKIRSVEDLSVASDAVLQRVPDPNIMRYRERARKFLATKDIAIAVRDLDDTQAQLKTMQEQFAVMQKALADERAARKEAEAELDEATPSPARKRKNGKAGAEAAA